MNDAKEQIIRTATVMFLQKGYNGVSLNQIVKASGVSKGGLYNYFDSKERLFVFVIQQMIKQALMGRDIRIIRPPFYSLSDFIHAYIDYIYNMIDTSVSELSELNNLFTVLADAANLFPEIQESMQDVYDVMHDKWVSVLDQAKQSGEIKNTIDSDQWASIFMNMEDGVNTKLTIKCLTREEAQSELINNMEAVYRLMKE